MGVVSHHPKAHGERAPPVWDTTDSPWQDREWLRERWYSRMSTLEIANEAGCARPTIQKWGRRIFGFDSRDEIPKEDWHDPEWLREKYYDEGLTLEEIADESGLASDVTILRNMEKHGLERRETAEYLRKEDAIRTAKHDDHEQIRFCVNGTTYYYDVHRLVAIAVFGLDAVAGSVVHHKNGIPWDNRPDNLELIDSQAEHARLHNEHRERDELGRYA